MTISTIDDSQRTAARVAGLHAYSRWQSWSLLIFESTSV